MFDLYETRTGEKDKVHAIRTFLDGGAEYGKNGFSIIRNFLNSKDLEFVKTDRDGFYSVMEPCGNKIRSNLDLVGNSKFSRVESLVRPVVEDMFSEKFYIHQSRVNYKTGFGANGWHWHSDFETWHSQDGMPAPLCVTAMLAVTNNTPENGALMVMPGSHRYFVSCRKTGDSDPLTNFADQKEGVPSSAALVEVSSKVGVSDVFTVEMEAGDMLVFDSNLLHVSNQNRTEGERINLFFVYNSVDNPLQMPFSGNAPRPEQMGHREFIR